MNQTRGKLRYRVLLLAAIMVVISELAMLLVPMEVQAADGYVEGTVAEGSTDDLLKLSTSSGVMLIKLDSDLVVFGNGGFVVGEKLRVGYKYGNDAYLHTSEITTTGTDAWGALVDNTNVVPISGKILDGTTAREIVLDFNGTQLKIRVDSTTVFENCHILSKDRVISVSVAGGSDGFFHAVKVSSSVQSYTNSNIGNQTQTADGKPLSVVTGKIMDGTTESVLYLDVNNNKMIIKIDSATDLSKIRVMTTGKTISVSVYNGGDGYLHAYQIAGTVAAAATATRDPSVTATVTGTVYKDTDDNTLFLDTSDGRMIIRMDPDTDISSNGLLFVGKKVSVDVQYASDAYLHASRIYSTQSTTTSSGMSATVEKTSGEAVVTGRVNEKTDNSAIYLTTAEGVMVIRIDANTQWPQSDALYVNKEISVTIYRGSDSYMHASSVSCSLDSAPTTTLDMRSQLDVTGTIEKIDGYTIYLNTNGTTMIYRMDNSTNFDGCRILATGKKVTINGATGSDGYWRAIKVTQAL